MLTNRTYHLSVTRTAQADFKAPEETTHCPVILPLVAQMREHIESLKTACPELQLLTAEIDFYTARETVTPDWYFTLALRVQAVITKTTDITELERGLLKMVPKSTPGLFAALTDGVSWKNHATITAKVGGYKCSNWQEFGLNTHGLEMAFAYQIQQRVKEKLAPIANLPMPNQGEVGLEFLIASYLASQHPMGMSEKIARAHGVDFSPLGFTLHDYSHSELDVLQKVVLDFAIKIAAELIEKHHLLPQDALELASSYAVKRHTFMMETLQKTMIHMRAELETDEVSYKKAMVGLFNFVHENSAWPVNNLFDLEGFEDFVKAINSDIEGADDDQFVNILKTSPTTGESQMTDAEIEAMVRAFTDGQIKEYGERAPYSPDSIVKPSEAAACRIERNAYVIKAIFTAEDGKDITYNFETLYSILAQELEDDRKLLAMAGIIAVAPDYSTAEDEDAVTQRAQKAVNDGMADCEAHFATLAEKHTPAQDKEAFTAGIAMMKAELDRDASVLARPTALGSHVMTTVSGDKAEAE